MCEAALHVVSPLLASTALSQLAGRQILLKVEEELGSVLLINVLFS